MTRVEAMEIVQAVKFMVDDYSDRVEMALDTAIEALKDQRPHGEWKDYTEERENIILWLSKFCLHIDMADKHLSDAEALEFWKKKMKEQFGWEEGEAE